MDFLFKLSLRGSLIYFCCVEFRWTAPFVPPFTRDSPTAHLDILWDRSWRIIYSRPETDDGLCGQTMLKIENLGIQWRVWYLFRA